MSPLKLYRILSTVTTVNIIEGLEMPVLAKTKIGRYFRTTVPSEVRKILEVTENDVIEWVFEDGKIVIRKGDKDGD